MEYVRAYATLNGIPQPDNFDKWHANMYMTYVNTSGLKLLYAGLEEITTDESTYLRIPMQSFIMHYKTNQNNRDVILASTFLMLMAFNDTATSLYPDSPDKNDVLRKNIASTKQQNRNHPLNQLRRQATMGMGHEVHKPNSALVANMDRPNKPAISKRLACRSNSLR